MKKYLSLILTALLLITFFASCNNTDDTSDYSDESLSEDSSGEESETSQPVVSKINPLVKENIDSIYTGVSMDNVYLTNVTVDCPYTLTLQPSETYSDTGGLLTNGIYGGDTFYQREPRQWLGFQTATDVVIDLGEVVEDLVHFETSHCFFNTDAIRPAKKVILYASNDGESYTLIGYLTNESIETDMDSKNAGIYRLTLTTAGGIRARYLKYSIEQTGGWMFVDEVAAYTYGEKIVPDEPLYYFYSECKMPERVDTEVFWQSSDSDYNDTKNLLLGLLPQIMVPEPSIEKNFTDYHNTPLSQSGLLTDGVYANESSGYSAPEYFHSSSAIARTFVFDIGKISAISDYKFSFYVSEKAALLAPRTISIYASENGVDWYIIKTMSGIKGATDKKLVVEGDLGGTYRARFVAVTMSVGTHTWCDEIEIIGTKSTDGISPLKDSGANKASLYPNKYISPDDFYGVRDVLLMYNEKKPVVSEPTPTELGMISEEETLAYVAYLDRDGTILDYMFDTFMYLPFGSSSYCNENCADSWLKYMDNTFAEGYNLDALNSAVATTNAALGNDDYKAKVILSILRPVPYERAKAGETIGRKVNFGSLDGKESLDFMKAEDREKALRWQVDEYLKRWAEKNYQHLELVGFYWYEEEVSYNQWNHYPFYDNGVAVDISEMDLANVLYTAEYIHSLDYGFSWIPWYKSTIYFDWSAYGIDVSCMQPNYYWHVDELWRIEENASITKRLGKCVEFECASTLIGSSEYRRYYKEYLKGGIDYGYMLDTIHMYYMGGSGYGTYYLSATAKNDYDRSVYDDTYKFIKGTLTYSLPEVEVPEEVVCKVNARMGGKIKILTDNTFVKIYSAPKYGTLELQATGGFSYTPFKGFGGEDEFYIIADNDYLQSEPVKVVIKVID